MQFAVIRRDLQDAGVRRGESAVNVLHQGAPGAPGMRRDPPTVRLKRIRDPHELRQSGQERGIRLTHIEAVLLDEGLPLANRGKALAASDRRCRSRRQFSVSVQIRIVQRLFQENEPERFQRLGYREGGIEGPSSGMAVAHMSIQHHSNVIAEARADKVEFARFQRGGSPGIGIDGETLTSEASRSDLERPETKRQVMLDLPCQPFLGIIAGTSGRIGQQPIVLAAAQQLIDRHSLELPLQIPKGRFNSPKHRRAGADAAPKIAAVIHAPPQFRDVFHILADQNRPEEIDNQGHNLRAEVARVGFTDSRVFGIGGYFDECGAATLPQFEQKRVFGDGSGEKNRLNVGDSQIEMILNHNTGVEIRPGFRTRGKLEYLGACRGAGAKRHNRISMAATQDPYDCKWGVVALLCVIAAVNYIDRTAISTVLPLLRADLHISDVQIAAAGTCFLWSYALGCPFSGYLSDRLRRGRVVFWSLLLWSVVTACTAFVRTVPELLVLRGLLGLVESAYLPAAIALIGDYHGTKTRATAMGFHVAGLNFGIVLGGVTVGYLGQTIGWRAAFLSLGTLGATLAGFTWCYLRDPIWPAIARAGTRPQSSLALFRIPSAMVIAGEMAIVSMCTWVFLNWLPLYFSEVHHQSLAGAGFSGTFFLQMPAATGIALGGIFSDRIGARRPERRMLVLGLALLISAPILFAFQFSFHAAVISGCVLLFALIRSLGQANEMPILCDLLEPRERATAFGIVNGANNIVGGAAVLASGYLKQSVGLEGLFTLTFVSMLGAALLCLFGYYKWMKADLREAALCRRVPENAVPLL